MRGTSGKLSEIHEYRRTGYRFLSFTRHPGSSSLSSYCVLLTWRPPLFWANQVPVCLTANKWLMKESSEFRILILVGDSGSHLHSRQDLKYLTIGPLRRVSCMPSIFCVHMAASLLDTTRKSLTRLKCRWWTRLSDSQTCPSRHWIAIFRIRGSWWFSGGVVYSLWWSQCLYG